MGHEWFMKFGMVTCGALACFYGVSHALVPGGKSPVPKLLGPPTYSVRNNSQILHGDQNRYGANFYMVDHEC